ncbi:hypothetical protein EC919_10930 [Pseudomonas graminis]|nr:hypothetical protein EC919_10930 [Pseudomonas graminis]
MARDNMTRSGKVQSLDLPLRKGYLRRAHPSRTKLWVNRMRKSLLLKLM